MSFILDALKKLEREKETRDPGVVMVGPVPWGGRDRLRRGPGLAVAGAVLVVALAGSFFWLRSGAGPSPAQDADEGPATPAAPDATNPVAPGSRAAGARGARVAPPPSRNLQLPGAGAGAATSTAVAVPPTAETHATAIREPAPLTSDEEARPPARSSPAPEFRLTAISSRDGHPIALLNDRLVREGDRFDGISVIRIGESSVEIEVNGHRRTVGF